ncbi:MAG TPA: hypothetical protein VMC07_00140, partial [Candidatus Omnitrophota bacterium]|nr:hypothetical protein [Candidatus Omnitrophota bacterium]
MKNRTKINVGNKFLLILILSVFFTLSLNFASAVFTDTSPQVASSLATTSSFDSSMCSLGQDFILQVSPSGCTPTVVRSDLLEEQDVQVYCPIAATQVNPMMNVKSISGISFSGSYSQYVKSIGFYPAQAALNLQGQQNSYPVLSNIGYAVIDLKQMPNESSMPNFVSGNLTAKMNYNANNVFGVGSANYYLPEMSDNDWQSNYPEYGFWNGRGYLRADSVNGNTAVINIYDSNLKQIGTASLKQGDTSSVFPISGFGFCSGGAQIKLNSVKNADTTAKLDVNGNLVEAAQGENFLDNNCQITSIQHQGLVDDTEISCSTDNGKKSFGLKIAPQIVLEINNQNRTVSLGDYLYTIPDTYTYTDLNGKTITAPDPNKGKSVYLGYIGSTTNTPDLQHLYVVLFAFPNTAAKNQLTSDELSSIASWVQLNQMNWKSGTSGFVNGLINVGKTLIGGIESITRKAISDQGYAVIPYNSSLNTGINAGVTLIFQQNAAQAVQVSGFAAGQDA